MKKIIALTIPIFFLLSCKQTKNESEKTYNQTKTADKIVELTIEPKTFKLSSLPETVEIKMKNKTSDTITTGDYYQIEKLEEDKWINISSKDMTFHDIGYDLKPLDNKIFEEKLLKNEISYNSGKYRVVKYYLRPDYQKTREKINIYAEFEIE